MDVFNNFHHYQYHHHQQPYQQYYNMPYYYPNEVMYPDYNTYPQASDFNGQVQVYNYENQIENSDYHLYAPDGPQYPEIKGTDPEVEEILKTNEEVWDAYQTGRFVLNYQNTDGHKKIILKEKGRSEHDDSDYTIRRFKVLVSTPRNSRVRDDHVLLVSFSHKSLTHSAGGDQKRLEIEPSARHKSSNQTMLPYQDSVSTAEILTGPGTELIHKIINGEEDDSEYSEHENQHDLYEDEYEPAYEIQTSPSKTSSKYVKDKKSNSSYYSKQASLSQSPSQSSSSESENYIDDIINKIKNNGLQSPVESRRSDSNLSRSQYSGTPVSRNMPFTQNIPMDPSQMSSATPVSVSYIGAARYANAEHLPKGSNSVIHYNLNEAHMEFVAEDSVGNMSRSSTRNHSSHEQHDTHSIGPGSMAGGSLFGGYIPNQVENNGEKSAFSDYNLTKNEDGDYVLRDANGKSEIFDGKSGLSKSMISRSEVSSSNSRSNISKYDSRSQKSSRVQI